MADWHSLQATSGSSGPSASQQNADPKNTVLEQPFAYRSRRSPVLCRHGCVASSQPLASSTGLHMLRTHGANAAEAAISMAAVLAVTEPCSTGLGGDMFALYYDSKTKQVSCVNGSGRAPAALTAQHVNDTAKSLGGKLSPHMVTVPGAAMGWEDVYNKFGSGKLSFAQLLEPAAKLAEEGFPVAPMTAHHWTAGYECVRHWHTIRVEKGTALDSGAPLTVEETQQPPKAGEIFRNPDMAQVLRSLGEHGARDGFYGAFPGQAIVETLAELGGTMTQGDLLEHTSTFPDPIGVQYRNVKLWQIPPNGQGIAGLIALKSLEALEEDSTKKINLSNCDEVDRYHAMMEMMRLGFADARKYAADTDFNNNPNESKAPGDEGSNEWLLNDGRIATRATKLYNPSEASIQGHPDPTSCTVSFQVVDKDGNAISFVNSNFMGFGTGIVPNGCGFSLQNRAFGFHTNDPGHPNYLEGGKRPFHTIIPGMLTYAESGDLYASLSNMGGFMQPQGHLQLTVNMVARGLDPQTAIDEPRFCIADGTHQGVAFLEPGVTAKTEATLLARGHCLSIEAKGEHRGLFGKAQIIKRDPQTGVLWAGSDGRSDGCAMGY
jgi:gamma-glutamyltranspeptidase/glutathione hydrolase